MSYKINAPKITEAVRDAIVTPSEASIIYNTDKDRLEYYDTYWGWSPMSVDGGSRDWGYENLQDFYTAQTNGFFAPSAIGTGSTSIFSTTANVGLTFETGTTDAVSGYFVGANISSIVFGTNLNRFETLLLIPTLSTAGENFMMKAGFFDGNTVANTVDGAYFLADTQGTSTGSAASLYWQIVTVSNSVRTFTTTTVLISTTVYSKYRVDVNAAGTSVTFYIDNVLVGTHVANIPTGSARAMGVGTMIKKSVGTANRTVNVDYLYYKMKFTTPR